MRPRYSLIALLLVSITFIAGCKGEQKAPEADPWSFVIYPGSRYLGPLTDVHKAAYKAIDPNAEVRPTAVYDTDASIEDVARYYANEYGYQLAAEAPADPAAKKPDAYFRSGDLAADHKAIEGLLPKLNLQTDVTKAVGTYRAAEIAPKVNRPRVTIQRPYFDVTKSEVVDRTFILMAKDPTK